MLRIGPKGMAAHQVALGYPVALGWRARTTVEAALAGTLGGAGPPELNKELFVTQVSTNPNPNPNPNSTKSCS